MILAAGFGTRLGEATADRPKILIDIGGITPLEWITRKLVAHGFNDIIINIHYCADMIEEKAPEIARKTGALFTFSDEREKLLDTGGGLYHAREFFDKEPFLLYNGDIVTDLDLTELYRYNIATGAMATLALRQREAIRVFIAGNDGSLAGWFNRESGEQIMVDGSEGEDKDKDKGKGKGKDKDKDKGKGSHDRSFIGSGSGAGSPGKRMREVPFTAISVINPHIFRYMEEGVYSIRDVYLNAAASVLINTYEDGGGFWLDIGSLESLERCRNLLSGSKSDFFY